MKAVPYKKRFRALKFDGDDKYSWAVFKAEDVKGITGVVTYGEATPVVCGMSKDEASYTVKRLSKEEREWEAGDALQKRQVSQMQKNNKNTRRRVA